MPGTAGRSASPLRRTKIGDSGGNLRRESSGQRFEQTVKIDGNAAHGLLHADEIISAMFNPPAAGSLPNGRGRAARYVARRSRHRIGSNGKRGPPVAFLGAHD